MSNPYTVLGESSSRLHGRGKALRRILSDLLKPDPDHVQVVGPKYIGKSTLLNHLASEFPLDKSDYVAVAFWNFRHDPAVDDAAFAAKLCDRMKEALKKAGDESAILFGSNGNSRDEISEVLKELESRGDRLLLILDEFDVAFSGSDVTRNFWDWLRSQAKRKSLRLVSGSRLPLRDLCKPENVKTSDFWNLFPPIPTLLGPFLPEEWGDVLEPFTNQSGTESAGAKASLLEWTGGVPLLVSLVLSKIVGDGPASSLDSKAIDQACEEICEYWPPCIADLWDDCGDLRRFLVSVSEEPLTSQSMGKKRFRELKNRGFIDEVESRVLSTCRLMQVYAAEEGSAVADLTRLFGADDAFRRHFPKILEMRLEKIHGLDEELMSYVRQAIRDLYENPGMAVTKLRDIAPIARNLVIRHVFPEKDAGGNHLVPLEWIRKWQETDTPRPQFDSSPGRSDFVRVPEKRWEQTKLFLAMTGSQRCQPFVTGVSKSTALILANLSDIGGGAGGHNEQYKFSFEFAAAVCLEAVVLCEQLSRELQISREPGN